jgi:succinate dehydrogenase / fumarate reductase cytochrome b subunit
MSTTAALEKPQAQAGSFARGRMGSILAVAPLGVWTILHLWNNLAVYRGGAAWEEAVTHHAHPLSQFATALLVMVPLLIHAAWGISRLRGSRPSAKYTLTLFGNMKYVLQRLSALGLLAFLGAHLWLAMLQPRLVEGHAEFFSDIAHEMHHHGPTLVVYLLGTLAVSYHLANGISTFAMGFGIVSSQRALKKVETLSYFLFAILMVMSWSAIYGLYVAGT